MKKMAAIIAVMCILAGFAGCGSSSADTSAQFSPMASPSSSEFSEEKVMVQDEADMEFGGGENLLTTQEQEVSPNSVERKIIWTVNLNLETKDMDALLESFDAQLEQVGGYVESSSISGKRADEYRGRRYAYITARVPSDKLDGFLETMGTIGTVINTEKQREDITFQYTDTENRMKSLKMEQDKLYELLDKATDLDSIIRLEERLTQVRYQIENYTSTLKLYDNQVDYSTVNLRVDEVFRVTEQMDRTLASRISAGFSDTLYSIKTGGEDLLVFFIVNIPFLVILAAVAGVVVFIVKKTDKRVKSKKQLSAKGEYALEKEEKQD